MEGVKIELFKEQNDVLKVPGDVKNTETCS